MQGYSKTITFWPLKKHNKIQFCCNNVHTNTSWVFAPEIFALDVSMDWLAFGLKRWAAMKIFCRVTTVASVEADTIKWFPWLYIYVPTVAVCDMDDSYNIIYIYCNKVYILFELNHICLLFSHFCHITNWLF